MGFSMLSRMIKRYFVASGSRPPRWTRCDAGGWGAWNAAKRRYGR